MEITEGEFQKQLFLKFQEDVLIKTQNYFLSKLQHVIMMMMIVSSDDHQRKYYQYGSFRLIIDGVLWCQVVFLCQKHGRPPYNSCWNS